MKKYDENFTVYNDINDIKGKHYNQIKVAYTAKPTRMIRFFFPKKMMALSEYRKLQMGKKRDVRDFGRVGKETRREWNDMVSCALDKAEDLGILDEWVAISRALVVFTVYAHDDRRRDVDNFTIVAINNALRENRIFEEDNFDYMRYYVQGVHVPYDKDSLAEGTGVVVMDIEDEDIKFHNWNPKELAEW